MVQYKILESAINSFAAKNFFKICATAHIELLLSNYVAKSARCAQIDNRVTEVAYGSESILSILVANGVKPGGHLWQQKS